jgi:carotenoid 1,2-hydratase
MSAAISSSSPTEPTGFPPSYTLDDRPGAYRWWYFDAVDARAETALVVIFFVGSVFSPYYASRLARGEAPSPADHAAVNVALYRRGARPLWVFSEYSRSRLEVGRRGVRVAQSWFERREDGSIEIVVNDLQCALRKPVRAEIRVEPRADRLAASDVRLGSEAHGWRCHVPRAVVRARFDSPSLAFEGAGYHDENWGSEPPGQALSSWSWGRVHQPTGTRVFFDAVARKGARTHLALRGDGAAHEERRDASAFRASIRDYLLPLPKTLDAGRGSDGRRVVVTPTWGLEHSPFYHRALARFAPEGSSVPEDAAPVGMIEHVDFRRFENPVVKRMIALRIARPERRDFGLLP